MSACSWWLLEAVGAPRGTEEAPQGPAECGRGPPRGCAMGAPHSAITAWPPLGDSGGKIALSGVENGLGEVLEWAGAERAPHWGWLPNEALSFGMKQI